MVWDICMIHGVFIPLLNDLKRKSIVCGWSATGPIRSKACFYKNRMMMMFICDGRYPLQLRGQSIGSLPLSVLGSIPGRDMFFQNFKIIIPIRHFYQYLQQGPLSRKFWGVNCYTGSYLPHMMHDNKSVREKLVNKPNVFQNKTLLLVFIRQYESTHTPLN